MQFYKFNLNQPNIFKHNKNKNKHNNTDKSTKSFTPTSNTAFSHIQYFVSLLINNFTTTLLN
jgi:hypothetical protein